jgi:hypothetical protein
MELAQLPQQQAAAQSAAAPVAGNLPVIGLDELQTICTTVHAAVRRSVSHWRDSGTETCR